MEGHTPVKKNITDIITRRQALTSLAGLGAAALFINPLMGLAFSGDTKRGKIVIDIAETDIIKLDASSIYYSKVYMDFNNKTSIISAYVVRDASFEGIMMPSFIVIEENDIAKILAFADDTEYIMISSKMENDIDKYISIVIDEARKQRKTKIERYINIIMKAHKKVKENMSLVNI